MCHAYVYKRISSLLSPSMNIMRCLTPCVVTAAKAKRNVCIVQSFLNFSINRYKFKYFVVSV